MCTGPGAKADGGGETSASGLTSLRLCRERTSHIPSFALQVYSVQTLLVLCERLNMTLLAGVYLRAFFDENGVRGSEMAVATACKVGVIQVE